MDIENIQAWMQANPEQAFGAVILASLLVFFIARFFIARGLLYLAERTRNQYDDIVVESLRPYRIAWLAPLFVVYFFADLLPELEGFIQDAVLFFTLWVVVITLNSLLNAVNTIYEQRRGSTGVPIQGYLDLVKLLFMVVGIILSISLITGQSPLILLSGLGALTAVLLLVFRDTLLSLVASVQISANDLVMEGDWIEVPAFNADGDVVNMTLHSIIIQNWDKTFSVIPTYKLLDVSYKNWRGMSESGGRRIKRAIHLDLNSVHFLDQTEIDAFKRIRLIKGYLEGKEKELAEHNSKLDVDDSVLVNARRLTNVGTFRAYIAAYLRQRPDLHQEGMTLLVRQLAPSPQGLPIEVYAFTKTTAWEDFESIQGDIFDHLLAVAPEFGLHVFQQPTGHDFANWGAEATSS